MKQPSQTSEIEGRRSSSASAAGRLPSIRSLPAAWLACSGGKRQRYVFVRWRRGVVITGHAAFLTTDINKSSGYVLLKWKSFRGEDVAWNWPCGCSPSVIKQAFVIVFALPWRKIAFLLIIVAPAGPLRGLWRCRCRVPLDWGAKLEVSVGLKIQAFA